jgi:hypothetical protein
MKTGTYRGAQRGAGARGRRCSPGPMVFATVRAAQGRLSATNVFHTKVNFVWGFCTGAQGA